MRFSSRNLVVDHKPHTIALAAMSLAFLTTPVGAIRSVDKEKNASESSGQISTQSQQQLRILSRRLAMANADVRKLQQQADKVALFYVTGKYQSGDERSITIYGVAIGRGSTSFGHVTEKSFLRIDYPAPANLQNGYFVGDCIFLGTRFGTNVYTRPSLTVNQLLRTLAVRTKQRDELQAALDNMESNQRRAQLAAETRIQAQKQKELAAKRAQLEKQRIQKVQQEVQKFLDAHKNLEGNEVETLSRVQYAKASLELYNRLQPRDSFPVLQDNFVKQMTLAASSQVRTGDIEKAMMFASIAFWPGASQQQFIYGHDSFAPMAKSFFSRQPGVLSQLTKAWADKINDQEFTARWSYGEMVKYRKFSEVIVRCAGSIPKSSTGLLSAALSNLATRSASDRTPPKASPNAQETSDFSDSWDYAAKAPSNSAPRSLEEEPQPTLDIPLVSVQSGKMQKLSSLRGKTVILYYFEDSTRDRRPASYTPVEQLSDIAKSYDPSKVQFVFYVPGLTSIDAQQRLARPDAWDRSTEWWKAYQISPEKVFVGETQSHSAGYESSPSRTEIKAFYHTGKNLSGRFRTTVIAPNGMVLGRVDFIRSDNINTVPRDGDNRQLEAYSFDKNRLDGLIIKALNTISSPAGLSD